MIAAKSMDVRQNFKKFCDKVFHGETVIIFHGETVIISRKKNENVVMVSEREYNDLIKARRNAEYLTMLDQSMSEISSGGIVSKSLDELKEFEA